MEKIKRVVDKKTSSVAMNEVELAESDTPMDAEEEEEVLRSVFPLGSITVENTLRMENQDHSKGPTDEAFIGLNTTSERNGSCAICYYDSAADDSSDEENKKLEAEFNRTTVVPVGRYSTLCVCGEVVGDNDEDLETTAENVCQHSFHTVCLYKWMKAPRGGFSCPICRGGLQKQRLRGIPELFAVKPEFVVKLWANGKVREEYFELNGKMEGVYKSYYLKGDIEKECTYQAGELNGMERCFSAETGKVASEVDFKMGQKHGWSRWFTSSGVLIGEAHYVEGQKSGPKREWFTDRPGRLMNIEHYHNGKRHGLFMKWSFRGDLTLYGVYRDGEKDGRFIRWFDSTHTIKIKEFYINGIKHGRSIEYYPPERSSGQCQDAVAKEVGYYSHGLRVGVWENYWTNGQLKSQTEYNELGKMDGLHCEWNRFGRCVKRFRYDDGEPDGVCETFDERSGQQLEVASYRRGQLHGAYVLRYQGNGKPKVVKMFEQGNELWMRYFSMKGAILHATDNRPGHTDEEVIHVRRGAGRAQNIQTRFVDRKD